MLGLFNVLMIMSFGPYPSVNFEELFNQGLQNFFDQVRADKPMTALG